MKIDKLIKKRDNFFSNDPITNALITGSHRYYHGQESYEDKRIREEEIRNKILI